jgi:small conductance mechanosensitive channel
MNFEKILELAKQLLVDYGPALLMAVITLVIGLWVIKILTNGIQRVMQKSRVEPSLHKFLASLFSIILKVLLLISVASMVGIETTSFIAILGAAGLAIGLALQGSLGNFAGGVLILLFKPYKVGDFVDAQGVTGTVNEIQVFNTVLKTPDNKTVIVPNGAISNGIITNFSTEETRRVDMTFGIGYSDDIDKAKAVIQDLVTKDERILAEPAAQIAVSELADSSVNFVVRVWAKTSDYWGIYFDMQEAVKKNFDQNNVSIPFPQQDVHIYNHSNS